MKIAPEKFELHIKSSTDFTKKFGKRVKSLGGRYSYCRGYQAYRFIYVPNTEDGRKLCQEILDTFAHDHTNPSKSFSSVVITRDFGSLSLPSWATVHYTKSIADALAKLDKHLSSDRLQPILKRHGDDQEAKAVLAKQAIEVKRQIESLSQHPSIVDAVETAVNSISATSPIELTDSDYLNIITRAIGQAYEGGKKEEANCA